MTGLRQSVAGLFVAAFVSVLAWRRADACQNGGPGTPCYPPPPATPCGDKPYTDGVCNNGYTCVVTTTSASWQPAGPKNYLADCTDGNQASYGDQCDGAGWCRPISPQELPQGKGGWCPTTPCTAGFQPGNPRLIRDCLPTYQTLGTPCHNGNACFYGETCDAAGQCGGGTKVTCPDAAPAGCVASYQCNYTPTCTMVPKRQRASCSTGNQCTSGDTCDGYGTCTAGPALVGQGCDDGNATTTGEVCDATAACNGGVSFVHLIPATLFDPEPAGLKISALATVAAGAQSTFIVTAVDPTGQPLLTYLGTVSFSSTDPSATLPGSYTFVAADAGRHTFPATFRTSQLTTLVATDAGNKLLATTDVAVTIDQSTLQLQVSGVPSPTQAFQLQSVMVSAHDTYQNTTYLGTVQFDSTDQWADLPPDYTFTAGDNGTHAFGSQVEFRTIGTIDVLAFDRDAGISARQAGIVVTAPSAPACVVQPGGCCTDADCVGVLFGGTCNVTQRACQCQTGYRQCRGGCIPSTSCCEHTDCPQPPSGGSASCDGSSCTIHCPSGSSPHSGDCLVACYAPEGDSIQ